MINREPHLKSFANEALRVKEKMLEQFHITEEQLNAVFDHALKKADEAEQFWRKMGNASQVMKAAMFIAGPLDDSDHEILIQKKRNEAFAKALAAGLKKYERK